jgi:uncharacterized protein YbcI
MKTRTAVIGEGEAPGGPVLAAISNAMVRLMREAVGKGPTRCKTHWAGPDILLVVLGGGYLEAERTLYEAGRDEEVRAARQALQEVLENPMRELIQEHVGRQVAAFLSAQHQDPDLQVEVFVLEPLQDSASEPAATHALPSHA